MGMLLDWIRSNDGLLGWLGAISALTFIASLVAIPWLVVHIPADYFLHRRSFGELKNAPHPAVRGLLLALKNLIGALFLLAGVAMLLLPGQGIITILIGLMLIDFPGKFALERWLIGRPAVVRTINWMRAKAHTPPLRPPAESTSE